MATDIKAQIKADGATLKKKGSAWVYEHQQDPENIVEYNFDANDLLDLLIKKGLLKESDLT